MDFLYAIVIVIFVGTLVVSVHDILKSFAAD